MMDVINRVPWKSNLLIDQNRSWISIVKNKSINIRSTYKLGYNIMQPFLTTSTILGIRNSIPKTISEIYYGAFKIYFRGTSPLPPSNPQPTRPKTVNITVKEARTANTPASRRKPKRSPSRGRLILHYYFTWNEHCLLFYIYLKQNLVLVFLTLSPFWLVYWNEDIIMLLAYQR